ncbi:hypothetical protein [Pseudomonas sp. TCU-HL1]|uniref:hypothetical protein n=1 Tax=Pseudomonas sp. TCU-HL1 TaxID=1856685 RepID=UPI00083CF36A|nr:hypothetical protein [Pseudomonas sp. TCU-HL1]AOE85924.1 hypothetical protein THL1_3376 [Pseudomonas sp. TCU-HL1]
MSLIAEHVEIRSNLTGDVKGLSARLRAEKAEQAVVITLDHASGETLAALGEALEAAARLITDTMLKTQQATVEQIIALLVPKAPIRPAVFTEAQMLAKAKKAVLESGNWLSAGDIASLAGFTSRNSSSQPNRWKRERRIFAIRHNGSDYFPIYALDKDAGYRPLPAMAEVLKVFERQKDGWGLAYWFASVNSYLGGNRPQEVLATQPERVVAAAYDEIQGATHG